MEVIGEDCVFDFVCFINELSIKDITPEEFVNSVEEALKILKGDLEK